MYDAELFYLVSLLHNSSKISERLKKREIFLLSGYVSLPLTFETGVVRTMFNLTHWKLLVISEASLFSRRRNETMGNL